MKKQLLLITALALAFSCAQRNTKKKKKVAESEDKKIYVLEKVLYVSEEKSTFFLTDQEFEKKLNDGTFCIEGERVLAEGQEDDKICVQFASFFKDGEAEITVNNVLNKGNYYLEDNTIHFIGDVTSNVKAMEFDVETSGDVVVDPSGGRWHTLNWRYPSKKFEERRYYVHKITKDGRCLDGEPLLSEINQNECLTSIVLNTDGTAFLKERNNLIAGRYDIFKDRIYFVPNKKNLHVGETFIVESDENIVDYSENKVWELGSIDKLNKYNQ